MLVLVFVVITAVAGWLLYPVYVVYVVLLYLFVFWLLAIVGDDVVEYVCIYLGGS